MKSVYVENLHENDNLEGPFLAATKALSVGKTGKPYLVVGLMDRTGTIEGRVWDNAEHFSVAFDAEDFVWVKGSVSAYMGKLQVKINSISKIDDSDIDVADFLPAAVRPLDEMFAELLSVIEKMRDANLKKLLKAIFSDSEIAESYKHAPAAKGMHHVYVGGLIDHSLSICRLAEKIKDHYENINWDLVTAGAILHDIGKTKELSYSRAFGYTDEGRLLGHITIGIEMIEEKLRKIDGFPSELAMLLKHMVLSHHGEYEYGSPKRPKTVEATILSYLDDMDAKINSLQALINSENDSSSRWTGYHRLYERYIYKGNCLDSIKASIPEAKKEEAKKPAADKDEPAAGRNLALF